MRTKKECAWLKESWEMIQYNNHFIPTPPLCCILSSYHVLVRRGSHYFLPTLHRTQDSFRSKLCTTRSCAFQFWGFSLSSSNKTDRIECPGKPNLLPVCLLICCVFFVAGKNDRFKSVDMSTFEQIWLFSASGRPGTKKYVGRIGLIYVFSIVLFSARPLPPQIATLTAVSLLLIIGV